MEPTKKEDGPIVYFTNKIKDPEKRNEKGQKLINNFTIYKSIGRGSYSKVKLVRRSYEDEKGNAIETDYAFKKMHKPTLQRERNAVYKKGGEIEMITNLDKVYQEINIWATLFHPQIARLYEIIDDPAHDYIYLVMELCDFGQIAKWDDKATQYVRNTKIEDDVIAYHLKGQKFENEISKIEAVAKVIFRQLFIGLKHMHDDMLIIHRDIKLDNLLYSSKDHTLKITDFNVSYKLKDPKEVLYDQDGTIIYRPPECSEAEENGYVGQLFDLWSSGICLLTYCQGKLPFYAESELEYQMNVQNKPVEIPESFSPNLKDLITKILEKDPKKRISLKDAQLHAWLQ